MERAWDVTAEFLPKLGAFLVILIAGYFVALFLGGLLDKVLTRVGFDRWVERGGIKQALSRSGYHVSDILGKIAFYTIFLFVLQMAFDVFGPNSISNLLTNIISYLPNVFVAIVITVIAASIGAGVRDIVSASIGGLGYGKIVANLAGGAILVIGAFAALNQLGIAPAIVNGLFYAMLAIIVGVSVVAIGGGGIQPMRQRWENTLNRMDMEIPRVRDQVQTSQYNQAPMQANPSDPLSGMRPDQGGYVSLTVNYLGRSPTIPPGS
jgi:hypothetical protein